MEQRVIIHCSKCKNITFCGESEDYSCKYCGAHEGDHDIISYERMMELFDRKEWFGFRQCPLCEVYCVSLKYHIEEKHNQKETRWKPIKR